MSPINWPHALSVGLVTDVLTPIFSGNSLHQRAQQPLFIPGPYQVRNHNRT